MEASISALSHHSRENGHGEERWWNIYSRFHLHRVRLSDESGDGCAVDAENAGDIGG